MDSSSMKQKRKINVANLALLFITVFLIVQIFLTVFVEKKAGTLYQSLDELYQLISSTYTQETIALQNPSFSAQNSSEETISIKRRPSVIKVSEQMEDAAAVSSVPLSRHTDDPVTVSELSDESYTGSSYAGTHRVENLAAPVDLSSEEILAALQKLAETDDLYRGIYEKRNKIPEKLLKNLVNNPELSDYVNNYTGIKKKAAGGLTQDEINSKHPLFLQWDERWAYVSFGGNMISICGCGPTCFSMVLFTLTRDESFTPDFCAEYTMNNGYFKSQAGTLWSLFTSGAEKFGVSCRIIGNKKENILNELSDGKILVFSVAPGDFTYVGHYIVVYGADEDGNLLVNDPNSVYRSTVHWDYDKISSQIKGIFSFTREPHQASSST